MNQTERLRLAPFVFSVLDGESMYAAAGRANVATTTLQRLVVKHPDYAQAVADGKVKAGNPAAGKMTLAQIKSSPVMKQLARGEITQAAAGTELGVPQPTVSKWLAKAWPELAKKT